MKLVDTEETVVLVTGSGIAQEEKDRPLAYWLKQRVDARGEGFPYRRAVVVSDLWYLEHRLFHLNPTIAIGGPGVNGVARAFGEELPTVLSEDDRWVVQADFDGDLKRACLWGLDATATAAAVEAFVERGVLAELLERIWRFRTGTYV